MTPRTLWPFQQWCTLLLALVWTHAGVWKLIDFDHFRAIIAHHAVAPFHPQLFGALAALEALLGLSFAIAFATAANRFLPLLLAAFAAYLSVVPAAAIERVGCGCFGTVPGARAASSPMLIIVHTLLGLAHAPILLARGDPGPLAGPSVPTIPT